MSPEREFEHESAQDAQLNEALKNFRLTVHAWSEAEISRPRAVHMTVRRRNWRLAAGWALGCALIAGGVSAGVHERSLKIEQAKIKAQHDAEVRQQLAAAEAREEEDLLAKVDSDVSREVPAAMEPLAQLMAEDGTR